MNDDNNNGLINHLRERFTENFNTLNKLDITEGVFLAKVVRTTNEGIIHAINTVAEERMLMSEQTPSHIDINNINICSHRQYVLKLWQRTKIQDRKNPEKRWIVNLEEKINFIRRRLSHLYLIINVNKTKLYKTPT